MVKAFSHFKITKLWPINYQLGRFQSKHTYDICSMCIFGKPSRINQSIVHMGKKQKPLNINSAHTTADQIGFGTIARHTKCSCHLQFAF